MLLFKTLRFLWPFLKEMILGDKTLKEALKTNGWRVALIVAILASVALNFFTIPRLLEISYSHVELKRKYGVMLKQCYPNSDSAYSPPEPVPAKPERAASSPEDAEYQRTKEFFERLKGTEH